jgi:excisionase family DNA binding protein
MKIELDRNANAAYIRISNAPIETTKQVSDYCNVDLDSKGGIVGIEMLYVSEYNADFKAWLNVAGLAEYLQKSEETIRRWIKSKEIPSYKFGREYCFDKDEIDEYIKGQRCAQANNQP